MMKTTNYLLAVLAIGLLAPLGCKKADQPSGPAAEFHGVKVDMPKLETEFASASQEAQNHVANLKRFFRYGQFPQALVELDQLSKTPNLTESQKKLVSDLIEQTRQVITQSSPQPGQ